MGYDEGGLARTGVGALTLFGVSVTLDWILAVAVTLILVGAFTYRAVTRHKQERA
ncbi:hypothetical protein ABT009_19635 [Streptomyces sp. NPDC002896]|uniref:hypothetical protein n=1 Tax=Streptomyces sp. NPDC002896 TaxID=3154438 RepID=UPI00332E4839